MERTPLGPEHPPRTPDPVGSDPPESPVPGLRGRGREVEERREKGGKMEGSSLSHSGLYDMELYWGDFH